MNNADFVSMASKACEVKDLLLDLSSMSVSVATKRLILDGLAVRLGELTEGVTGIIRDLGGQASKPEEKEPDKPKRARKRSYGDGTCKFCGATFQKTGPRTDTCPTCRNGRSCTKCNDYDCKSRECMVRGIKVADPVVVATDCDSFLVKAVKQ